jgi:lipoyl(octanoyl) transferase
MKSAQLIDLGRRDYKEIWELQLDLVSKRSQKKIPDTLLLVEHFHVYTKGRKSQDLREFIRVGNLAVPCYEIERGGDITYHGPGQLVAYPILHLQENNSDIHLYLRHLEEVLMKTCSDFGIATQRRPGFTGVWTTKKISYKIASIGIATRHWVSYHGLALNVNTDLNFFHAINPCGLDASLMTSMQKYSQSSISLEKIKDSLSSHFSEIFGLDFDKNAELKDEILHASNVTLEA